MAAVPKHLTFDCPACSEPIRLELQLGPTTKEQGQLTARLTVDEAPLKEHLADAHGLTPEAPRCGTPSAVSETHADSEPVTSRPAPTLAADAAATAGVTFHVHRAPDEDIASAAIRREMRRTRPAAYRFPPGDRG